MVQSRTTLTGLARASAVGGLLLTLLLAALDATIVGTAMPRVLREFGGLERYTWVTAAYLLTSTVTIPLGGKLSDLYGRKPLLLIGAGLFIMASALCGLSANLTELIAFRALQGVGGGMVTASVFAAVPDLFSPTARARLVGLFTGTYGLASIVGPLLGGFLTDAAGWRSVFFINLPLGTVALAVLMRAYPSRPGDSRTLPVDYLGALTLVGGVGPLLLALSLGGREMAWSSPPMLGLAVFAALMLVLFVRVEARAADPIIPLGLLRSRAVGIPTLGMALMAVGMFAATLFAPLFVQGVAGRDATTSGSALTPMMCAFVAASVGVSQLIANIGRYRVVGAGGMAVAALGLSLMSMMDSSTDDAELVRNLIVVGLGLGAALAAFAVANQNAVPLHLVGVSTALGTFARAIGGTFASAGLGTVLARGIQSSQAGIPSPNELAASLHDLFLVAMLIVVGGAVLALFVKEIPFRGRAGAA